MTSPGKPKSSPPPPPVSDEGKTVWLDLSTPIEATPQAVEEILEAGSIVGGRYKLLELIGEGRISRVFKALDQRAGARDADATLAVKVLTFPIDNPTEAETLLSREIRSLHETRHPNIVRVMSCERQGFTVYLPMELVEGQSLQDRLEETNGAMPKPEAMRIIKCLTDALEFSNSKNIVHGHLRPSNVILTKDGGVKTTDFSLARVMGTGRLDPRDDVFALACIAWTLFTGDHPFKGKSAEAAREAGLKLARPGQLSENEFRALSRALEFERSKRTLSSRRFYSELSGQEVAAAGGSSGAAGSSKGLMTGIVAAVVVLAAIAAYFLLRGPSQRVVPADAGAASNVATAGATAANALPPGAQFRDCPTCPLMQVIAPGQFNQGSPDGDPESQPSEMPQHNVAIGDGFAIGVYEVTVGQYRQFMTDSGTEPRGCTVYDGEWQQNNEVSWKNAVEGQTDSFPVSCVSWQDAKRFAAWLTVHTHHTYRLPSASEWEYAARGGSAAARPWSDASEACKYANVADQTGGAHYPSWSVAPCADKYAQTAPVGQFAPNALGLHDMLGNVFEWTEDCWADTYAGAPADGAARTDADCSQRELRGGSWISQPAHARVTSRDRFATDYRSTSIGFRLVRELAE